MTGKIYLLDASNELRPMDETLYESESLLQELLAKHSAPAEVIAVEVRQFVGDGVRTLVPRVLGQTEPASDRASRSPGRRPMSRTAFSERFVQERPAAEQAVLRRLEEWAAAQGLESVYLTGRTGVVFSPKLVHGGRVFQPVVVRSDGAVVLPMRRLVPRTRFADAGARQQLYETINAIPGFMLKDVGMEGFPKVPLANLVESEAFDRMRSALDWMVRVIREGESPGIASNP